MTTAANPAKDPKDSKVFWHILNRCWLGKQELLPSMTGNPDYMSAAHAMLSVLAQNGADRVFLVPGESYLGLLDALSDFPQIDVVTCRHEAGAGFMACADGRLTRRPGVLMVSRGPGATNGSISLHLNSTHSPVKNQ